MNKNRVIYIITNNINSIIYVGKDSYNYKHYIGSGKNFLINVKKYGKENFKKEIICYCDCEDEMNFMEIFWIAYFKQSKFLMYNIHKGGNGGDNISKNPNREEICKKISISRIGKKDSLLGRKNKSKASLNSEANKKKWASKEWRDKISINNRKRKYGPAWNKGLTKNTNKIINRGAKKLSKTKKAQFASGELIHWTKMTRKAA